MATSGYWSASRAASRRWDRRRVLASGVSTGAALAAAAFVGCGDDSTGSTPTGQSPVASKSAAPGSPAPSSALPAPPAYSKSDTQSLLGELNWSKIGPQVQGGGTPTP